MDDKHTDDHRLAFLYAVYLIHRTSVPQEAIVGAIMKYTGLPLTCAIAAYFVAVDVPTELGESIAVKMEQFKASLPASNLN